MATVTKRKWSYKGEARESWVVRYVDQSGARRLKTFDKKKEADGFRVKVETEQAAGGVGTMLDSTVRDLAERFLRHAENRLRDGRIGRSRYDHFRSATDLSILPLIGQRKSGDLTADDVEELYNRLCRERGLLPQTAKEKLFVLQQMFNFAVERKHLNKNPVADALKRLRGIERRTIRTFAREEVLSLLQANAERAPRQQHRSHHMRLLFIHLAAFCGLRRGEIAGLTLSSIDHGQGIIHVRNALTLYDELKGPKTKAGRRDVPMPEHIAAMLKVWLAKYYLPNHRNLVFRDIGRPVKQFGKSAFRQVGTDTNPLIGFSNDIWYPALKRAGLYVPGSNLHFHALRHFAASYWISNGMPLTDVAALLGHSSFDMTLQVYAHPMANLAHRRAVLEKAATAYLPQQISDNAA